MAEIKTVYSIQSKNKSNPITQHCNTEAFIRKKKRNQIQSKRETKYRAKKKPQTPRANQTHGAAATARRRSSLRDLRRSLSSRLPRSPVVVALARRRRSRPPPSLARRRRSERSHTLTISAVPMLGQSASRYFSPFFSLTLSLSLSLSLK